MEQIPFHDPQDAAIADNVLQHLRHALQWLASPAQPFFRRLGRVD